MLKAVILPDPLFVDADMSTNLYSEVVSIQYMNNIGIQIVWTGSPLGEFQVQLSNNRTDWEVLPLAPVPYADKSAGSHYLDLNTLASVYIRLAYIAGSGSGTLNSTITAKIV